MPTIPDKSINMILTDLPYGTTKCKWDIQIPFEPLWNEYKRIIKNNGVICLFGIEPFSSYLRLSNLEWYRYDWIWEKSIPSNFLNAKKMPLKIHENISIFYNKQPTYNPIKWKIDEKFIDKRKSLNPYKIKDDQQYSNMIKGNIKIRKKDDGSRFPQTIISFNSVSGKNIHPTQKPVLLFEYLIKTYTNEGDTILVNCAGSGTTGIASYNTNRNCIMIEKEEKYCDIIKDRMNEVTKQKVLI